MGILRWSLLGLALALVFVVATVCSHTKMNIDDMYKPAQVSGPRQWLLVTRDGRTCVTLFGDTRVEGTPHGPEGYYPVATRSDSPPVRYCPHKQTRTAEVAILHCDGVVTFEVMTAEELERADAALRDR